MNFSITASYKVYWLKFNFMKRRYLKICSKVPFSMLKMIVIFFQYILLNNFSLISIRNDHFGFKTLNNSCAAI